MLSEIEMVNVALKATKSAIEKTYTGVCDLIVRKKVKDPQTRITNTVEVKVLENQPCRLSFEPLKSAQNTDTGAAITQTIKLFVPPEVVVDSGTKIVVRQNGFEREYAQSGVSAIYPTHQEIIVELFKGWA